MRPLLIAVFSCLVEGTSVVVAGPPRAENYDVDCAVILCLAAGFPAEPSGTCAAASGHWFLGAPFAAERVHHRFRITLPASEGALPYISPLFLFDPGRGFARSLSAPEQAEYGEWPDLPVEVAP